MRKILIIALVPVFVLALAAIVILLMPLESFRAPLEKAVSHGLGRGVHIAGGLHASLYPEIGLSAGDVSIDNVPGGEAKLFAHVDTMAVGAKLLPLLSRRIDITRLALDHPSINLEVDKDGIGNWNFGSGQGSNTSANAQLSISGLRIQGGEISYLDMRTGKRKRISDANASLTLESLGRPAQFDLDAVYEGEKLAVTGSIDNPQAFTRKEPAKLALELKSPSLHLKFDGSVTGASQSSGNLTMSGPSLRQLMQRAGTAVNYSGLGAFSLSGTVSSQDRVYALKQAKLDLDGMKASLDLSVDMKGAVPLLKGIVVVDRLDAATYLVDKKQTSPDAGWSTEPLSLTGLKLADADIAITADRFLLGKFVITQGVMHVVVHEGRLSADLIRAGLFGGNATGQVTADGSVPIPAVTVKLDVKSVAMKSLLQSAIKVERIEGSGAMSVNVAGSGKNQQAIMNSLNGTASAAVHNGVLRGVDLAAVSRTVQNPISGLLDAATSSRSSTDFTEAGGTFTIRGGVAHNQDFHLLNPLVRISGSGDIDLGRRTINFRIEPKLGQGQAGLLGASGLGVPFQITGPWTKPSYRPDLVSAVGGLLVNQVQRGTNPVTGLLGNVLGGKKSSGQNSKPQLDLNSLFGR